jgi:hypothetical protein
MARLFVLVMAAAIAVPTAVLGPSSALAFRGYTVAQVERVFGTQGIALHEAAGAYAPDYTVDLAGRFPDHAKLEVRVLVLRSGSGESLVQIAVGGRPRNWGLGSQGNVLVDWQSDRPCEPEAARVRAALRRLGTSPGAGSGGVRCTRFPHYP